MYTPNETEQEIGYLFDWHIDKEVSRILKEMSDAGWKQRDVDYFVQSLQKHIQSNAERLQNMQPFTYTLPVKGSMEELMNHGE